VIEKYGVEDRTKLVKEELREIQDKLLEKTASDGEHERLVAREKELMKFLCDGKLA